MLAEANPAPIALPGVHGKSVRLNIETLWSRNITLTTRLVDTVTIPMLMKMVGSGRVKPRQLITSLRARRHNGRLRRLQQRDARAGAEGHHHQRMRREGMSDTTYLTMLAC